MSKDYSYNYDNTLPTVLRRLMDGGYGRSKTSMVELADYTGTTRQAISQYRNGRVMPNAEKLCLIAEYFNVSVDFLLGRSSYPNIESLEILAQSFNELAKKLDTHESGIEIVGALNGLLENLSDKDALSLSIFLTSVDTLTMYGSLIEKNILSISNDSLFENVATMLEYQSIALANAELLSYNVLMFTRNLIRIKIEDDLQNNQSDISEYSKLIEKIYDMMSPGLNTPNIDRLNNKSDDSTTDNEIVKKYRDEIIPAMVKKYRLNEKERYETALNKKIVEDTDNG